MSRSPGTSCHSKLAVGWLVMLPVVLVCFEAVVFAAPAEVARELDSRRLIGTAQYENDDFKSAAAEFRRCLELAPDSATDRFNLAVVLTRAGEYEKALALLAEAQRLAPSLLGVHYVRGIIYKRQGKYREAIESLNRVVSKDRQCWGAHYNLGFCYKNLQEHNKARAAFEAAVEIDPNHPSAHYQLITVARRTGDVEEAKRHAEIFERVKDNLDKAHKTVDALERSKYSDLIRVPRLTGEPAIGAAVQPRFDDVTDEAGLQTAGASLPAEALPMRVDAADYDEQGVRNRYVPAVGGAVALGDYDGDGDLDVYVVGSAADPKASANRLYRNQGDGSFVDVTEAAGVGDSRSGLDAVFGDYDNDGQLDLYVVNDGPNVLYRNLGDGKFEDVSRPARADEPQFGRQALFVDYDHDNDLDLLVVNDVELGESPKDGAFSIPDDCFGQVNTLLRNNGNGTFLDQTDEAGLLVDCSQSRAVVSADFDGDHDTDLFVCNADAESLLFANARLGKFNVAATLSPPVAKGATAAAVGDFDRDGDADLLVAVDNALSLYVNDAAANFQAVSVPLPADLAAEGVGRIAVLDYNNDGWADLLLVGAKGGSLALLEGGAPGGFHDRTSAAGLAGPWGAIADVDTGDVDGDGNQDIVLLSRDRGLRLLRNDGTERHWLKVRLAGERVNRSGYGAVVEIAAGGHYQRCTAHRGWVHFGLAALDGIDVVRVTWPNGVAQNVIRPHIDGDLKIVEQVKVSASCAFLWADNGAGFELVNEILGVGPLGVPMAPGVYHPPDCTELTKIEADQLVARDGTFELRLTEDLREVAYADQIALRVVDHPAAWEIVPNEMFTAPPFPEDKFFAVGERLVPRTAVDDRRSNVLSLIRRRDGRFPTFARTQYDGLAKPHSITLDLGDLSGAEQIVLYLDGWIYWAESSTVMAIAQDPRFAITPLSLEVRDAAGQWQTAIESVGLPTSKGAVVPVDLSGRFLCDDYHVRLSTNMCVYFDRIFVSTGDEADRCRVTELPVAHAQLRYRGFSRMTRDELGFERFGYADAQQFGPWSPPRGMLTRYGEVTSLLGTVDDTFVTFGPGDELVMRFDGRELTELPPGWVRDFIFYANGWVKDGDLNTALSDRVGPLPFHGMSGYPYGAGERYPRTPRHRRYLDTYQTRRSMATVGRLSPLDGDAADK